MNPEDQIIVMQSSMGIQEPVIVDDNQKPYRITDVPDNGKLQPLVDHCMDLYGIFSRSTYRAGKIKEMETSRKVYEQIAAKTSFPFKDASNIVLPLLMITVDNLEPRIVAGLVGKDPIVNMEVEGGGKDDMIDIVKTYFNNELKNTVGIKGVAMQVVHDLLLDGTVYPVPKYETRDTVRRDFVRKSGITQQIIGFIKSLFQDGSSDPLVIGQDGLPMMQDVKETVFDGGKIDLVPFVDIYCPDDIGTIDEWERCDKIRRVRPTYGELMNNREKLGYMNIGTWLLTIKKEMDASKGDNQSPTQKIVEANITGAETISCLEFHIKYYVNKDEEKEESEQTDFTEEQLLVTIAEESKVIIRIVKQRELNMNNESLVKRIRMNPENERSFGTGIYGKIKSAQDGASEMINIIINSAYILMMLWYFYDDSSGLAGEVEIYPGAGIKVDSVKGILFPTINIRPDQFLDIVNLFINLWERSGNISNNQLGRMNDRNTTATEVMAVIQEANIRFNYQSEVMRDEFIVVIKTLFDLYYQYMPIDKKFMYGGKEIQIPRSVMKRNMKWTLTGSSDTANKMIERRQAEDLKNLTANDPLINPMQIDQDLLKAYDKTDFEKYLNPQASAMLKAFFQNPEIGQVVQKYLQTKTETAQAIKGAPAGQQPGGMENAV